MTPLRIIRLDSLRLLSSATTFPCFSLSSLVMSGLMYTNWMTVSEEQMKVRFACESQN